MAKTLADLITRTRHKLALPSSDQMVPDADLTMSINSGMNAMAADYDWPWLMTSENIATVDGTAAYALPTRHVRTLYVQNSAYGTNLQAVQRQQLIQYAVTGLTGFPLFYATFGASTRYSPTPDGIYTLNHVYIQAEPPLTSGSQEPLCPEHYSDVIVLYACVEEATRMKDFQQRKAFQEDIGGWLRRIKDATRQSAGTLRVRTRGDWSV